MALMPSPSNTTDVPVRGTYAAGMSPVFLVPASYQLVLASANDGCDGKLMSCELDLSLSSLDRVDKDGGRGRRALAIGCARDPEADGDLKR